MLLISKCGGDYDNPNKNLVMHPHNWAMQLQTKPKILICMSPLIRGKGSFNHQSDREWASDGTKSGSETAVPSLTSVEEN